MNKIELGDKLIDAVIEGIEEDILRGDLTGLDELLRFIPVDYLIGYLREGEWVKYKELLNGRAMYENPQTLD